MKGETVKGRATSFHKKVPYEEIFSFQAALNRLCLLH